jgi:hypothetical protein
MTAGDLRANKFTANKFGAGRPLFFAGGVNNSRAHRAPECGNN